MGGPNTDNYPSGPKPMANNPQMRTGGRWLFVAVLCVIALMAAGFGFGWTGYAAAWGGTVFKALSGGALGFLVSRVIQRLDLSELAPEDRPAAGIGQALLVSGFAIALALGA